LLGFLHRVLELSGLAIGIVFQPANQPTQGFLSLLLLLPLEFDQFLSRGRIGWVRQNDRAQVRDPSVWIVGRTSSSREGKPRAAEQSESGEAPSPSERTWSGFVHRRVLPE
jgi:hypothetical protein